MHWVWLGSGVFHMFSPPRCSTPRSPKDVMDVDFVAWQADHDAYGFAGQKCSAQSMLFMHERLGQDWRSKRLASSRFAIAGSP